MSDEERFSLKDHLFNKQKVRKIAREIRAVEPTFAAPAFEKQVLAKFPALELMERIYWIRDVLKEHLPPKYRDAVHVLLESLPAELDPDNADDDFGDFIYAPHGYFVAEYGLDRRDLSYSLAALKKLTTRFSVEGPLRFLLNAYPNETLDELLRWTQDTHYHVRRAASEGTRPLLPWAPRITLPYTDAVPILSELYDDRTRYVTRSVANHVNDISKVDPDTAIALLKNWKKEGKQGKKEMEYIVSHALRTLVKEGNVDALRMLGYDGEHVRVKNFVIRTPVVPIGKTLEFSLDVVSTSTTDQNVMIDYVMYFKKANGSHAPKVHKIAKKKLRAKETLGISKKHPLRVMTTRKLYPGKHEVEVQVNGRRWGKRGFEVVGGAISLQTRVQLE